MPNDVIIIGGGISGLSALHFLRRKNPACNVTLYEAESRLGGVIGADMVKGFLCEWGPSGLRDRDSMASTLCADLGIENEIQPAGPDAKKRYILRGGKLRPVPMSPGALFAPGVISVRGRLRAVFEPFVKKSGKDDESVYDFARRRLGLEIAEYLVQPLVTGIFAGDARELSVRSVFPPLFEMEQESGSIFRGAMAKLKAKKKRGKTGAGRQDNSRAGITSLSGGIYSIIKALQGKYETHIHKNAKAISITKRAKSFEITFSDNSTRETENVIVAIPAYHATSAVRELSNDLAVALGQIQYAPIAVACLGYAKEAIKADIRAFGYLVPRKEPVKHLGAIWVSSVFPNQAPSGKALFRILLGGAGNEDLLDRSDDSLLELAKTELAGVLNISQEPEMSRLYRWNRAVPQYRLGHYRLLEKIDVELSKLPGLHLAGNAYTGVGVVDCIKRSSEIVSQI